MPPKARRRPNACPRWNPPVDPFYGDINPFYGDINPFYGDISPFWGDISPFWGDINPFYGNIDPFYGPIDPFWGDINPFGSSSLWAGVMPFWQDEGPRWGNINANWSSLQKSGATDYTSVQLDLKAFVARSRAFWGGAVKGATGKNFNTFAEKVFAQYGIDPRDGDSLAGVTAQTRSAFFLGWYDSLMSFTGVDHVDWWMGAVHWSPLLTQIQAPQNGHQLIVGLLDSTPSQLDDSIQHLNIVGGFTGYVNGHGAAVGSLISAQHDGQGIMGIAPNVTVDLYNPFDQTGTASWSDVQKGINTLYSKGAHVVNLSLGVPGTVFSSDWANVMSGLLMNPGQIVFVKAAGNEGVMQTTNVMWTLGLTIPQNVILVGSVGPTGEISRFSNTPGEACITLILGICAEQNKLKYRFLVAPGELMLVSDNAGGVTRMSGTSFAAPLVTGAVALLQTRWPWLQQHSAETVQIILQSADDLGAPGVDPVYGWGMLDVQASQSPLDFNDLVIYRPRSYVKGDNFTTLLAPTWSASKLRSMVLTPGQLDLWQAQNAYIVAFENIGLTYRDFTIPLSTAIVDKSQKVNGESNRFQSYLYKRMIDWANGASLSDFSAQTAHFSGGDWSFSLVGTASTDDDTRRGGGPFHSEFVASNRERGITLRVGEGDGAHALTGGDVFAFRSDFDPTTGGVNPVLGFASGGGYARGEFTVVEGLRLNVGFSQQTDDHTFIDPSFGELHELPLAPYQATASVVGLDYTLTGGVTLNASYTRLNEADGLLGAQGGGPLSIAGGTRTDAITWGGTAALAHGIDLIGSATFAHSASSDPAHAALGIAGGGIDSTAYEIAARKTGVFGELDQMRISFAQPLHIESGALNYSSIEVVDRDTGEIGSVAHRWALDGGNREYRAEAIYAAPVFDGRADVSGFAMLDFNPPGFGAPAQAYSVGARIRFGF